MLDELQGFHLEPTNMCTLKCPRCSRTEFINQFPKKWTNKNLNLEHLKQFLDIDLHGKQILINGTYGDAIYYDQLFELIKYLKTAGSTINLSTNGSYKTKEWWTELNQLLDQNDEITFGIDGLPTNFIQYRINADWTSINDGINILRQGSVKLAWQYILFSYNENDIEQTKILANALGFNRFFVLDSNRWDHGTEWLTPTKINEISRSKIHWKDQTIESEIDPQCVNLNAHHYISADGFYTPCCMSAEHRWYYKTEFYKNQEVYDISKTTISRVLTHLKDFYSTLEDAKLNYCTFNCPKL
jgi:MoaA/NifB/PqqE/SkfB family radical SAM enzyme